MKEVKEVRLQVALELESVLRSLHHRAVVRSSFLPVPKISLPLLQRVVLLSYDLE